ncbi:ribosome recycling factor [candidate division GN15 bacterium]|jgi:ribosome recycling factor|nr:ribosome recycling factor [candidate division GN15 bacterium]
MLDALYKETKEKMEKSVEAVQREFSTVRTGKATPQLLDSVRVDAYGSSMPLNQLATISAPEPRLLVVQAYDKSTVGDIIKAIQVADLGFNPSADGQLIRIPVPALNEERRQQLVKHCKDIAEKGRIAIRNARRDANDAAKKAQKDKEISEDQEADAHTRIQELTDDHIKKIDDLLERKEKDLMEV